MRSRLGLCVLGLLCLHNLVKAESGVRIFCDDPSVQKAVHSAVDKFNLGLAVGQKMALHQILSATKSESGDDTVYSLQFTLRRSQCSFSDSKPWTACDYLLEEKEPFPCNATVKMLETLEQTEQVDCLLDDHIVSNKVQCLGCPMDIETNSEDLKNPLSFSVSKFNLKWNHTHLFKMNKVVHATRQVVAGFRFRVRFDLQKTTCAKSDHADLHDLCEVDVDDMEFANCNSTVDVAPWRHEVPNVELVCEEGELVRPVLISRRRPPGWSPLRNISRVDANLLAADPPTTVAPPTTTLPPTTAAVKETSSEEDSTSFQASSAPASDSPFHCPSKPWKVFKMEKAAPTEAAPEEQDGTFSDSDLLA